MEPTLTEKQPSVEELGEAYDHAKGLVLDALEAGDPVPMYLMLGWSKAAVPFLQAVMPEMSLELGINLIQEWRIHLEIIGYGVTQMRLLELVRYLLDRTRGERLRYALDPPQGWMSRFIEKSIYDECLREERLLVRLPGSIVIDGTVAN